MASSAKDIRLRELKNTITQLKTMISEQTELIRALRLVIDEKTSHEKALQEQVDYLTKKLFGSSSERRSDDIPGQQSPGTEGRRTPGTDTILHVAVPQRRRRPSCHYFIWLFTNRERQPCKGVSGRLSRVSGNGWLSGLQQPAGYQAMFLPGTHPPVFYRCRSQRETV